MDNSVSNDIKGLSRIQARQIIEQMRIGILSPESAHYIDFGTQKWYEGMDYFLDRAEAGSSQIQFISGRFGAGKTHLMYMAMYYAQKRNFIVSYISANPSTTKLHKFDQIYRSIIENLQSKTIKNGIEQLLKDWKSRIQNDIPSIVKKFDNPSIENNFRIVIQEYLTTDNPKIEEYIVLWLSGEKIKLPELRVRTTINPQNGRDMLRSLSILIREMGYFGLVVLIDEFEQWVLCQRSSTMLKVYNNFQLLLDNAGKSDGMKGTIFYLTAPGESFKIPDAYPALKSHLESGLKSSGKYRGVIINLEDTPMKKENLYSMAKKVRDIHSIALEWDAAAVIPDQKIEQIVDQIIINKDNVYTPRLFATTILNIIDEAKQGSPSSF